MSDENITAPASGNAPDESPKPGEASSPQDITDAEEGKEQRKAPRFRVGWHTDIFFDDKSMHHGFINDISTLGASIFLDSGSIPEKSTLHIHVPPLSLTSEPHIIVVSGKVVYVVYDGDKQLFRAAFVFLKFHLESDLAYLGERLTKYQSVIHERASPQKIQEL
jgi:hypothetical protein